MAICPDCGFEVPASGACPVCAAAARRSQRRKEGRSARLPGGLMRLALPALLAPAFIGAAAGLYLAYPERNLDRAASRLPIAVTSGPQQDLPPAPAALSSAPTGADTAASAAPLASASIPTSSEASYVTWMLTHSEETAPLLEKKWERAHILLANRDIRNDSVLRAFLYTPREFFARRYNQKKAYDDTAIPIGFGQTISGPHMVVNMTESIAPQRDDRILEIGTGSGYQSALLSELCDHVYTIEIVPQLYAGTDKIYASLERRYPEYGHIVRSNGDGYFGWLKYAPFQKIIVTAGIDHIPPPLLRQLAPNGVMVIPIGPPSGQTVLRIVKRPLPNGGFAFERSDIFSGRKVIFVPFTTTGGMSHSLDDSSTGGRQ